jgi:hypothetical protein
MHVRAAAGAARQRLSQQSQQGTTPPGIAGLGQRCSEGLHRLRQVVGQALPVSGEQFV